MRYKNPQTVKGSSGAAPAWPTSTCRSASAATMALMQAISKRVLEAEAENPGTVLDHQFLAEHALGLDEFRAHLATLDEHEVLEATGLTRRARWTSWPRATSRRTA